MIVFDPLCGWDPNPLSTVQKREIDRMLDAGKSAHETIDRVLKIQTVFDKMRDHDWRRSTLKHGKD